MDMTPELSHELAVFVRILNAWIGYLFAAGCFVCLNYWWEYSGHYDKRAK